MNKSIEKLIRYLYGIISNSVIKNLVYFFVIGILTLLVVLIAIYPIDIWEKCIAELYVISFMGYFVVATVTDYDNKRIGFNSISVWSFLLWCLFIPILLGSIVAVLLKKYIVSMCTTDITDLTFWLVSLCASVFLVVWSFNKLKKEEDLTCYLDKYSTALIAIFSILTIVFDFEEKTIPIVLWLGDYFVVQLMIKEKICRIHSFTNSKK